MLGRAKAFGYGQINARIVSSRIEPNAGGDPPAPDHFTLPPYPTN
jgi:hypothetical protein